jgi:hypothetical protein
LVSDVRTDDAANKIRANPGQNLGTPSYQVYVDDAYGDSVPLTMRFAPDQQAANAVAHANVLKMREQLINQPATIPRGYRGK